MAFIDIVCAPSTAAARVLNPLQAPFALAARGYLGSLFLQSGYLKYIAWDRTVSLFQGGYPLPWLSPHDAAVAGTAGELVFPALLVLGLWGRLGALGLVAINAMAVVAYSQALLAPGSEAALGQRVLWVFMLLFLVIYGPGKLSLDYFLNRSRF